MAATPRTTLTFLGAAGTVTGSKFLLSVGDRRVLVDAGLFQGERQWRTKNWEPLAVDVATLSDIVVTHAHLDHIGYLPALVRAGYRGPIWCTTGTSELVEIVLRDAAKLQEQDADHANKQGYSRHHPALPLYTTEDVERLLPLVVGVEYDADLELTGHERPGFPRGGVPEVTVRFTRAGHILGSASVNVWTPSASVLFSGDLGRTRHPVLRPREIPPGATFALVESTYGDREHPDPLNLPHEGFADVIRRTIERGGTVVVPAFAIDRTEVVLMALSEMERDGRIPDVPVFVDSPMGTAALDVYQRMQSELRSDLREHEFVRIPDLTAVRTPEESKALSAPGGHGPCVIIASSGMASGGRVLHHLERLLPDPRNAVVLTGYQGVGTRGRQLAEGAEHVKIHGAYVPVRAEMFHDREFSVHADRSELLDWLRALEPRPAQLFCVHGEPDAAGALARLIEDELGSDAVVPQHGEVVLLDPALAATAQGPRRVGGVGVRPAAVRVAPAPDGLRYRLLTAEDELELARAVSDALERGYVLHLGPTVTVAGDRTVLAQAVVWAGG